MIKLIVVIAFIAVIVTSIMPKAQDALTAFRGTQSKNLASLDYR